MSYLQIHTYIWTVRDVVYTSADNVSSRRRRTGDVSSRRPECRSRRRAVETTRARDAAVP